MGKFAYIAIFIAGFACCRWYENANDAGHAWDKVNALRVEAQADKDTINNKDIEINNLKADLAEAKVAINVIGERLQDTAEHLHAMEDYAEALEDGKVVIPPKSMKQ